MTEGIGDRLRELRVSRGMSQEDLEERSKVTQGTISAIEVGRNTPRRPTLEALARGLGVAVEELTGEVAVPAEHVRSVRDDLASYLERIPLEVPVYDQEAAAAMGAGADPLSYVPVPAFIRPTRRSLFAMTVRGASLEPDISAGDIVVIDPDASPSGGRYVVATDQDGAVIVKRYLERRAGAVLSGNGGEIPVASVTIVGTVVYKVREL